MNTADVTRPASSMDNTAAPGDRQPIQNAPLRDRLGIDGAVRASRAALQLPEDLSFEGWERLGGQLGVITNSSVWWLGDWLLFGEEAFPDRYRQAVATTSLSYQTLRNYAWVARRFPPSRRRDTLSLQHHAAVAALPASDQNTWLDLAEKECWSLSRLRKEIRAGAADSPSHGAPVRITIQVAEQQQDQWNAAATRADQPLADWIALTLDKAATQLLQNKAAQ